VTILDVAFPPLLPGAQVLPAGIRELYVRGVRLRPLKRSDSVPCYEGPSVTLDGVPIGVRPRASIGALLRGLPMAWETCDDDPIALTRGQHEFRAAGLFQPTTVSLESEGSYRGRSAIISSPSLYVQRRGSGYRIDVHDATGPFYLVLGQNVASGWRASIQGRSLGRPLVLDGFSAGWRIDRGGTYSIDVAYAPERRQEIGLLVSILTLPLIAGIALVGLIRRRRS
jgi:arabinofuranan 3-O-arabinosyltransferase